jgi:hypothetical protein
MKSSERRYYVKEVLEQKRLEAEAIENKNADHNSSPHYVEK